MFYISRALFLLCNALSALWLLCSRLVLWCSMNRIPTRSVIELLILFVLFLPSRPTYFLLANRGPSLCLSFYPVRMLFNARRGKPAFVFVYFICLFAIKSPPLSPLCNRKQCVWWWTTTAARRQWYGSTHLYHYRLWYRSSVTSASLSRHMSCSWRTASVATSCHWTNL